MASPTIQAHRAKALVEIYGAPSSARCSRQSGIPSRAEKQRDDSEATLVQSTQSGDEQAFATLYQLHNKLVYSVCLRITKDVAEAEDLTQDAFMQVFRNLNSFRGNSAFSTWLYRLLVGGVHWCRGSRTSCHCNLPWVTRA
jgi:Sigma-70 region 2